MAVIGVLHPGAMGAAVGGELARAGHRVLWCPAGRSPGTAARAAANGLEAVGDLAALLGEAEVVFSICPPAVAEEMARDVADHGFGGVFVEANAISPARVLRIAAGVETATAIDGGLIGAPPRPGTPVTLCLAGPEGVESVARLFTGSAVRVRLVGAQVGRASALKLAYGSYQKASRVLAALSHALAAQHGVGDDLLAIGALHNPSPLTEVDQLPSVAARAWRWGPEQLEVADALAESGLPDDMARAAEKVLARWTPCKDDADLDVGSVLERLRNPG
jgi:3-hydroxyisobutyrate dehydrogenase-like beta-hydroxyacid dehydrogenase